MGGYFCISVGGDYHWTGGYIQRIDLHQNINYIAICSGIPRSADSCARDDSDELCCFMVVFGWWWGGDLVDAFVNYGVVVCGGGWLVALVWSACGLGHAAAASAMMVVGMLSSWSPSSSSTG